MTTAIIAKDYAEARQASRELGIGHDWVYPHDEEHTKGRLFTRIVFVTGYAEGPVTVEIARAIYEHATADAPVTYHDLGTPAFDSLIAPFLPPDTTEDAPHTPRHAARDRMKAAGLLLAVTVGGGIGVGLVTVLVIVGVLPWVS